MELADSPTSSVKTCFYFSRYAPDRSPTDPYVGLPRFLAHNLRLIGFWGDSIRPVEFSNHCKTIVRIGDSVWRFPFSVLRAITQTWRDRPDFVISCVDDSSVALGWIVSVVARCPFYIAVEDPPFTSRYSEPMSLIKKMEKHIRTVFLHRALSSCTAIFSFVGKSAYAEFLTPNSRILALKNGASDEALVRLESATQNKMRPSHNGDFTLGYVGAIDEEQGIPELLDAMAIAISSHDKIRLSLIGDIDKSFNLAEALAARHLEANVTVTGWVSYGEMLNHLSKCDAGCYTRRPSRWAEAAYPLKVCEYLGLARPIVSWDYPGCRAMLGDGKYGELVMQGNVHSLASSLLRLADPDVRRNYRAAITHDIAVLSARHSYEQILKQVISPLSIN